MDSGNVYAKFPIQMQALIQTLVQETKPSQLSPNYPGQGHVGPSLPRLATLSRTGIWGCRKKEIRRYEVPEGIIGRSDDRQALEAPYIAS